MYYSPPLHHFVELRRHTIPTLRNISQTHLKVISMAQHTSKSQLDIYSKDSKFVTEFTDKNGQVYHVNGVFPPIDLHRYFPF
jgi:hypothetical protein